MFTQRGVEGREMGVGEIARVLSESEEVLLVDEA